jgi:hypothetical protein
MPNGIAIRVPGKMFKFLTDRRVLHRNESATGVAIERASPDNYQSKKQTD